MREIRDTFNGQARAVLPLFDSDIRGVDRLAMAAERLFAWAARHARGPS